jgi:alpha-glucosidase (family GH31 glycosyl hydrolase)
MIGGNGYGEVLQKDVILPNRELYIRWLQMSAYLSAMQFSFAPWDSDEEVTTAHLYHVSMVTDSFHVFCSVNIGI